MVPMCVCMSAAKPLLRRSPSLHRKASSRGIVDSGDGKSSGRPMFKFSHQEIRADSFRRRSTVAPASSICANIREWSPRGKHILASLSYLCFIAVHASLILQEPVWYWRGQEVVMYFWALTVFFADLAVLRHDSVTGWMKLRYLQHVIFAIAFIIRLIGGLVRSYQAVHAAWYILSLAIIVSCLRIMELISISKSLGTCAFAVTTTCAIIAQTRSNM